MFNKNTKSNFFGRMFNPSDEETEEVRDFTVNAPEFPEQNEENNDTRNGEGELAVDVYQTAKEVIIQTMPAGVHSDDLSISITPEVVIINGKREAPHGVDSSAYVTQELYWGSFSRRIELPAEILPDEAEAVEKHGLLIIRLPKIDKTKQHVLKIKSV